MLLAVEDVRHPENRVIFRKTFQCGTADFREVDSASLCQFNQFGFAAELAIREILNNDFPVRFFFDQTTEFLHRVNNRLAVAGVGISQNDGILGRRLGVTAAGENAGAQYGHQNN
ncbi:hypothetical protein SDC9_99220 [bioreactor metagenome]|uniref:Uncharacterized protein n=1 Tax=bioreactor metagenome TaxID=1076179 RepID=A0A645AJI8_9ZZZZ